MTLIAIGLDIAFEIMLVQVAEELLEVLAETLFLCGLLEALRARLTVSFTVHVSK